MSEEAGHTESLLASLRHLAQTFVSVLQTRLEIFASDIDEERARLARVVVLAVVAAFCLGLAVVLLVLFVVVVFWDSNRLLAIGVIAAVFALGALVTLAALRSAVRQRPKFLSATLAELHKDGKELDGR